MKIMKLIPYEIKKKKKNLNRILAINPKKQSMMKVQTIITTKQASINNKMKPTSFDTIKSIDISLKTNHFLTNSSMH